MNISESNAAIHGITNEIVKDASHSSKPQKKLLNLLENLIWLDTIQTNLTFQY